MSGLSPVGPGAAAGQTTTLPPWMQTATQGGAFNAIQGSNNIPQFAGLAQNVVNNPYAAKFQAGANTASDMGAAAAGTEFNTGAGLIGAGNRVLETAFDPQSALYQKYLGLTQQQAQAMNAQSGVASTPYAAGINAQTMQNFNIGWQAQQLQNQIAGLNAAGGAYQTGVGMETQAPLQYLQSQQLPFNAFNAIQQSPMAALAQLQQYGGGALNQNLALLGMQPKLAGAQNETAQTQAALQQQEVNQIGQGIGAAASIGMAPFTGGASLMMMPGMGGGGGMNPMMQMAMMGGGGFGGNPSFGGGGMFTGDAYGGNSLFPLEGLSPEDYGMGF